MTEDGGAARYLTPDQIAELRRKLRLNERRFRQGWWRLWRRWRCPSQR